MVKSSILKSKNFSVICSDPGGAFAIKNYLEEKKINPKKIFLTPTSKKIFGKKYMHLNEKNKINFLKSSKIFITGTSWNSKIEINFIADNIKKNIKIISFLDSWFNYKRRFYLKNKYIYPHEIWTFDIFAYKIAKKIFFNKTKIKFIKLKSKLNYKKILKKNNTKLLYLTEPISELAKKMYGNKNFFHYDEVKTLDVFLDNNQKLFKKVTNITVRFHPNENKKKYNKILKKYKNLNIHFSKNKLINDINRNNIIVGTASNILFLCSNIKKKVFSVLKKIINISKYHLKGLNI